MDIAAIQSAHLFGEIKLDASGDALLEAPETRLNLKLLGVLAFDNDEKLSRALIELQPGDEKPFGIGATVMSGTSLQAILPDRVVLSRAGKLETLFLEKNQNRDGINLDQSGGPGVAETPGDGSPVALTQIRQELLQDPSKASEYLRVQPANKDGKLRGYRVYPGKDRSIFSQAGLKPGDLVTQVNGVELDDASKALKMLSELKDTNQFDLVVERGGQSQTINVNLN